MYISEVLQLDKISASIKKIDLFLSACNKGSLDYYKAFAYRNLVLHEIGKTNDALKGLYNLVPDFNKMNDEAIVIICDAIIDITLSIDRLDQSKKYIEIKKKHLKISQSSRGLMDDIRYYVSSKSYNQAITELHIFLNEEISLEDTIWAYENLLDIYNSLHEVEEYILISEKLEKIYQDTLNIKRLMELNYQRLEIDYEKGNYVKVICDANRLISDYDLNDVFLIKIATLLILSYLKSNDFKKASIIESNYEDRLQNVSNEDALRFAKAGLELYQQTNSLVSIKHYEDLVTKYSSEKKKTKTKEKSIKSNVVIPNINIEEYEAVDTHKREKNVNEIAKDVPTLYVSSNYLKLSKLFDMLNNLSNDIKFRELYRITLIELSKFIKFDEAYLVYYEKEYKGLHYKKERAYDKKLNFEILDDTINFIAMTNEQEVFLDLDSYHGLHDIINNCQYEEIPYGIAVPLFKDDFAYASLAFWAKEPFLNEDLAYETIVLISKMLNSNLINEINKNDSKNQNKKMLFIYENMKSGVKELIEDNIHLSSRAKEILGCLEDLSTNDYLYHIHSNDVANYKKAIDEVCRQLSSNRIIEYRFKKNGEYINVRETLFASYNSGVISVYSLIDDITLEIKDKNDLIDLAYKNPITNLYTELKLIIDIQAKLQTAKFSLAVLDIIDFKLYEELYGINFANQLVFAIGKELIASFDKNFNIDVYHLGYDRYAILLRDMNDARTVENTLLKSFEQVKNNLYMLNKRVNLRLNCGVFRGSKNTSINDANKVLLNAYDALSNAKLLTDEGHHIAQYDNDLAKQRFNENQLITHISEAIDHGKIGISYKQVVNIKKGELFAYFANISLDNFEVDYSYMQKVIKRRRIEEMIDKYVLSNASKELKMLSENVKTNLNIIVKISDLTIEDSLVSFIETQNNFFKTTKKNIIIYVESANNKVLKKLKSLGYMIASNDIMDVYQGNANYYVYNVSYDGFTVLPKIINVCEESNVEIIVSGINSKEDLLKIQEFNIKYIYGEYYKKSIRMKKLISKIA